jgi:hypothetical protein
VIFSRHVKARPTFQSMSDIEVYRKFGPGQYLLAICHPKKIVGCSLLVVI